MLVNPSQLHSLVIDLNIIITWLLLAKFSTAWPIQDLPHFKLCPWFPAFLWYWDKSKKNIHFDKVRTKYVCGPNWIMKLQHYTCLPVRQILFFTGVIIDDSCWDAFPFLSFLQMGYKFVVLYSINCSSQSQNWSGEKNQFKRGSG